MVDSEKRRELNRNATNSANLETANSAKKQKKFILNLLSKSFLLIKREERDRKGYSFFFIVILF